MTDQEYKRLYDRCTQGVATKEEQLLFEAYKDSFNLNDDLPWQDTMGDYSEIKARISDDLHSRLGNSKKAISKIWYYSAAVLAMLLSLSLLFVNYKSKKAVTENTIATESMIRPGGNKAILITEDGEQIQLHDTDEEVLAIGDQGGVYMDSSSRLVYTDDKSTLTSERPTFNTLITPKGGEYELQLSDGTKVWLNADSKLKYPVAFKGSERVVELQGEAYFEVAKRKNMPFKVLTNQNEIEVLGTHFNVSAYSKEKYQATLLEGSIQLKHGQGEHVKLKPGDQATLNQNLQYDIEKVNASTAIGWKEGVFVFNNQSIKEVMSAVARWYDVRVTYQGDVSNKRFGGTVSRYSNIEELLKTIQLTESIRFKIKGKEVIVMP